MLSVMRLWSVSLCLLLLVSPVRAAGPDAGQRALLAAVDRRAGEMEALSRRIWEYAEVALKEEQSAAAMADYLAERGFRVERGVARLPTAFLAIWGQGKPVVGILAEYDALPGLSQAAGETAQHPVTTGAPGHGCEHN